MNGPAVQAGWAVAGTLAYGDDPAQVVELGQGDDDGPVLVLLHGGYWRPRHGRELMWPLAGDLADRRWTVANVEYRRGSGWRDTVADVGAALSVLRAHWPGRALVLVGHSAGGHLALLHARSADAVLALAPVTDLVRGHDEAIGEGAVLEFMGTSPADDPDAYARATPAPESLAVPSMFVHGLADGRVPIAHTDAFLLAVPRTSGGPRYLRPTGVGHLDLIDPAAGFWREARSWLAARQEDDHRARGDRGGGAGRHRRIDPTQV